jgi:hypothetical protein
MKTMQRPGRAGGKELRRFKGEDKETQKEREAW